MIYFKINNYFYFRVARAGKISPGIPASRSFDFIPSRHQFVQKQRYDSGVPKFAFLLIFGKEYGI